MRVLFRPFGSSAILGGYDRDGPQLYMIEPSGVAYVRFITYLCPKYIMLFVLAEEVLLCGAFPDINVTDYCCGFSAILEQQLERVDKLQRRISLIFTICFFKKNSRLVFRSWIQLENYSQEHFSELLLITVGYRTTTNCCIGFGCIAVKSRS